MNITCNESAAQVTEDECGATLASELAAEPFFVNFLREPPEPTGEETEDADLDAPKIYEQIVSFEQLKTRLLTYQEQYNETVRGASMDMVFFKVAAFITIVQNLNYCHTIL